MCNNLVLNLDSSVLGKTAFSCIIGGERECGKMLIYPGSLTQLALKHRPDAKAHVSVFFKK